MKIILDCLSGLVFALIGFISFAYLHSLFGIELEWGGDKGQVFWGIFLGLPIGSVFGFIVADRLFFRIRDLNLPGISLALVVGVLGNILGIYLLDRLGSEFAFFLPFLTIFTCTCLYNSCQRS